MLSIAEIDLELNMDILDDFVSEAEEVHAQNPFVTYGEPLHLLRQFGVAMAELDLLDEAPLSPEQIHNFCHLMLVNLPESSSFLYYFA